MPDGNTQLFYKSTENQGKHARLLEPYGGHMDAPGDWFSRLEVEDKFGNIS